MAAAILFQDIVPSGRESYYRDLSSRCDGSPNGLWLAQIVASWQAGEGVLPHALGLKEEQFDRLLGRCFPGYRLAASAPSGKTLDFSRMLEKEDLEQLLHQYAVSAREETDWLIAILVAACLGSDHLWQDLGLWNRSELSGLLEHNFPELAARNQRDMKWKKFLYKQLCEAEGLYLCRAPSCEVCLDYSNCFGDEK
jgi:nitrogen fixation protein NifQ